MLGDISLVDEIYIVCGYTDMRKSIDGLCALVENELHMDPRRSALYLFCGDVVMSEKFKLYIIRNKKSNPRYRIAFISP